MRGHAIERSQPGDVYAIGLDEELFGYVRILQAGALGVLPVVSTGLLTDPARLADERPRWHFEFEADLDDPTEVLRLGHLPFASEEEAWAPPRFNPPSPLDGQPRILVRGVRRQATQAQIAGLPRQEYTHPERLRAFLREHRSELRHEQGTRAAPGRRHAHPSPPPEASGPVQLVLRFPPGALKAAGFGGRDEVEEPLEAALRGAGLGGVVGAGSGPEGAFIDLELAGAEQVEPALAQVRGTLRRLGAPAATVIRADTGETFAA